MTSTPTPSERLRPELGLIGTIALGLGSIVGTGVFVSIGIGAGIAGPAVLVAIAVGALVALCNGPVQRPASCQPSTQRRHVPIRL